ncbi:MAG TPA: DUF1353 domain-containing protein [Gammaproteobacteria bacterium]|nr:DUF1353 domain-containing protein [Gammaproteobacteria bacterium]
MIMKLHTLLSIKLIFYISISLALVSCASAPSVNPLYSNAWNETNAGKIEGDILIEWVEPDKFKFIPTHGKNPFTFIRMDGDKEIDRITPNKEFYTDGGSIPQVIKIDKDYSSWRFAPAYIIHDWLFEIHQCDLDYGKELNHKIAAQIMAEAIKTQLINEGLTDCDTNLIVEYQKCALFYNIYKSVENFSEEFWNDKLSTCDLVNHKNIIRR